MSDAALGHVLLGHDLAFCFDRPRRPIPLGEGLDRDHDLVLLSVGLHLPKFLELPAIDSQIDRFLAKLPALARMAVSAGLRKRAYLRRDLREPGLAQGFRLERARLVIVPIGIDDVVRQFLGESCVASPRSNDLALRILGILRDTLQVAGDRSALNVALDDAVEIFQGSPQLATGLSCPDPRFPLARQLETVADWHDRTGTATLTFPENFRGGIEELREVVRIATKRTTLVRLRFRRPSAFPEAK